MNLEHWNQLPTIWPRVISRAWLNPEFRALLLSDPHTALKEFGLELPEQLRLQVVPGDQPRTVEVTGAAPTLVLRLPDMPQKLSAEVEQDLGERLQRCSMTTAPW